MSADGVTREILDRCDSMPFDSPGTIQPFGCLLALDPDGAETLHASANLEEFLGISAEEALEAAPGQYLPRDVLHGARNLAGRSDARERRSVVGTYPRDGDNGLLVIGHMRGDVVILEFAAPPAGPGAINDSLDRLRWLHSRFDPAMDVQDILETAVKALRGFSGFHRVMAYRFRPDGSGEVLAESREPFMDSFIGLRFPEYDVPPRVKLLYTRTPIRMSVDVQAAQVPLLGKPGLPALDLSLAGLRGMAAIHGQYLANMGVRGSLTLPIVIDGELWGLFACHHRTPRYVGSGTDLALEFAGQTLSRLIAAALVAQRDRLHLKFAKIAHSLSILKGRRNASELVWTNCKDDLLAALPSTGVCVLAPHFTLAHGETPPEQSLPAILEQISPFADGIAYSDRTALDLPDVDLGGAAGALCLRSGALSVMFFRAATSQSVAWAGSPEKTLGTDEGGATILTPRASFASYMATLEGRADAWEPRDLDLAKGLWGALERSRDAMLDRDAVFENLALVVQELNHRVRNVLALVQSILRQSKSDDAKAKAVLDVAEARILSLALAQEIMSENGATALEVGRTLEAEARPFNRAQIRIDGPVVGIEPEGALIFALVIHELFANAARHGALSTPMGHLGITWDVDADGLKIAWRESNVPHEITPPDQPGFGATLIESAFAYELGGSTDVRYGADGVHVDLQVPKGVLAKFAGGDVDTRHPLIDAMPLTADMQHPANGKIVLLVEDQFVIGRQMSADLLGLGVRDVQLTGNAAEALQLIATSRVDFAVLDINLGQGRSTDVAAALQERGIPFLFFTGYDIGDMTLQAFPDIPVLRKPVGATALDLAIREELGREGN